MAGAVAHYASEVATHGAEREGLHWPIGLRHVIVAAIFGLFAAIWFSLSAMLTSLLHNSWNIHVTQTLPTQEMFFITRLITFAFLTLASLQFPITYFLAIALVDLAVIVVLLAVELDASALAGLRSARRGVRKEPRRGLVEHEMVISIEDVPGLRSGLSASFKASRATTRTGRTVTTDRPGRPISRGAGHRHRIPQSAPGRVTRRTI
jgi:hypothetical protein